MEEEVNIQETTDDFKDTPGAEVIPGPIVIHKNAGPKIPYTVDGVTITFDDRLTVDLSAYQDDNPIHLDVCTTASGALILGTSGGNAYVAEIDIPAAEYEDGGEEPARKPLDITAVKLTLWAIGG